MDGEARTPDELETLLEDAFLRRDAADLADLFERRAALVAGGMGEARGPEAIGRLARALWRRDHVLLAEPQRIVRSDGTALILAREATSVARRDDDGGWRYAISHLNAINHRGREKDE